MSVMVIPAVELPRWSLIGLAENFARVQILLSVFDGDPDKWLDQIARHGGPENDGDVAFLLDMRQRLADDPALVDDMRRIVREFADCLGPA